MAAPVGHIFCALALLKSGTVDIVDHDAFLAGASFPDIRYGTTLARATTHKMEGEGLSYVLSAPNSFEMGRRDHVLVDKLREEHMLKHNAYRFIKNGPFKTQMLKLVEDHILFDRLKGNFDENKVFQKIYPEERAYSLKDNEIESWHNILKTYLDQTSWFAVSRYLRTFNEIKHAYGMPAQLFENVWQSIKTIGFLFYAYLQLEMLSRNKELRAIILDFYENKMGETIKEHANTKNYVPPRAPLPLKISFNEGDHAAAFIPFLFYEAELFVQR